MRERGLFNLDALFLDYVQKKIKLISVYAFVLYAVGLVENYNEINRGRPFHTVYRTQRHLLQPLLVLVYQACCEQTIDYDCCCDKSQLLN